MKLASRSLRSRPVRSRNFTNAVCANPRTMALPSTKNFVSMVSAWRVAMPFQMWENRHLNSFPVRREVNSKAPTNVLIAPLLARTGSELTQSPQGLKPKFFALLNVAAEAATHQEPLPADGDRFGSRLRVTVHRSADARAGGHAEALIEQGFLQRGEEQ